MKILKDIVIGILGISMAVGAASQFITLSNTPVQYNSYFQGLLFIVVLYYFVRKWDRGITAHYTRVYTKK